MTIAVGTGLEKPSDAFRARVASTSEVMAAARKRKVMPATVPSGRYSSNPSVYAPTAHGAHRRGAHGDPVPAYDTVRGRGGREQPDQLGAQQRDAAPVGVDRPGRPADDGRHGHPEGAGRAGAVGGGAGPSRR